MDLDQKLVDQFILQEIDTVPHLEALLLLWNSRPKEWSDQKLANSLYLPVQAVRAIVAELERRGFVSLTPNGGFLYRSSPRDNLIAQVDQTYRRQVVRIANLIHSKPSASLRDFARAFRLKKEQD